MLTLKDGFSYGFDSSACKECKGRCCTGESGYIWVTHCEILTLSKRINITKDEFITKYLSKIGYRYTLNEVRYESGFRCIFFDTDLRRCSIYENRPKQCRTFPFWNHFKSNTREVEAECPGIYKL